MPGALDLWVLQSFHAIMLVYTLCEKSCVPGAVLRSCEQFISQKHFYSFFVFIYKVWLLWWTIYCTIVYTERNRAVLLINLHLLRRFQSKWHPGDGITTDAIFVSVKRYLLHEKSQKNMLGYFFILKLMHWQSWFVTWVLIGLWSPWLFQALRHILGTKMSIIFNLV